MSTTLIRAYESFFSLIDVEGTTEGRALSVSTNKSYAQIFYAKENSSQPRFFFMADIPSTNNLTVQIFTVSTSGSGSTTSYTPNTQIASFSGEFSYLNSPDNETEPFSDALWYYVDTEINLVQGSYYAVVFTSDESVETSSPKIYFSKKYRNEIFPIFLGKTLTEDWSNELVPTTSSGSLRTGSFVLGFTGREVNESTDFDSGSVTIGGTGASARRGYSTYLYVKKESSISNDVAVQFFQEPPSSPSNGTGEESDQAMMRFYYFKEGTLPLSGSAFYNKTINASPTLDENSNFVLFTQPDRLPPFPKPFLPDSYMDTSYKEVGIVSIYEGFEENKHRIEYERGIIEDTSNRSSLEYWAHFAERTWIGTSLNERDPTLSSNPSYIDFSLEQKGKEVEPLNEVSIESSDADLIRGYTTVTKIGKYYLAFPKYKTFGLTGGDSWWENCPAYTGDSEPKMTFKAAIANIDDPDSWSLITVNVTSDFDPALSSGDERGYYPTESVLGNPHSNASYSNRYVGMHDTLVATTNEGDSLFALMQVFPSHSESPTGESNVFKPNRPFYNLLVSFTDFSTDTVPSTLEFKAIRVENADPYDGRFEARQLDTSVFWGLAGDDVGTIAQWATSTAYTAGEILAYNGSLYSVVSDHTSGVFATDLSNGEIAFYNEEKLYPNIDADYKAAKFLNTLQGDDGYIYFTVTNNRHESKIESINGDRRYGPVDAISKFGIWKVNTSISNGNFRSNSVLANLVPTSSYKRTLYNRIDPTEFLGEWTASTTYSNGNKVTYLGNLYERNSNADNNGSSFETEYDISGNNMWDWKGFAGTLDGRGFDPNLEHEYEITTTLDAGGNLYLGTSTALTQTAPSNITETFFAWTTSFRYQKGDYVRNSSTNYLCTQNHTAGTFANDLAAGYWIAESSFAPVMGEVYRTNDFVNFIEIIDGKINQSWLSGYTDNAIDLTSQGGAEESFKNNDRVVFMDLVENILHVWTSPSAKYDQGTDLRTPFHIAHDINFGRTRVLRKFPIWKTYEEDVYFDLSNNGGNEVDATTAFNDPGVTDPSSFEKGTIFNNSGEYYVLTRKIIHSGGKDINTDVDWGFSDILAAGLLSQDFLPYLIENNEFYKNSFRINKFIEGQRVGDYIYLSGVYQENESTYHSDFPQYRHSLRWISYDRRTLNDAFTYYDDETYKIDEQANDFITVATNPVSYWAGNGDSSLTVAPYHLMEFLGSKWGVYHHKTLAKYEHFESSQLIKDYPALLVTDNNPRIAKYCSMIAGAPDFTPSNSSIQPSGTIENDIYSKNPRLVSQGGICYLIVDNEDRGAQIYKTYGYKQNPKEWGLSSRYAGTFYGNVETPAAGELNISVNAAGDRRGIYTYNFNIEHPCFERSLPGYSTLQEFNSYSLSVSKTSDVVFLTEIKRDREEIIQIDDINAIDESVLDRHIFRISTSNNLPQNISFLYNLRETALEPIEMIDEDDLSEGQVNLPDYLVDPTKTTLTLKHAETLEELFTNPEKIEIPLAQERIVSNTLFDKIMLYSKSLPTDLQSNFFRLESTNLIINDDTPSTESTTYVTYSGGEKTIEDPFAEVLIKALRFTDVDFSGAKQKSTSDKNIVVTGIAHRNQKNSTLISNPEDILNNGIGSGVYLSSTGFVDIIFPKPIYISRIGFNAYYDGSNSSAGDLSVFNISAIPILEKQIYNSNLYSNEDWVSLGSITFDASVDEDINISGLSVYTRAIRISLDSGLILRLNNLTFKTFVEDTSSTFSTSGSVFNPDLILIDDLKGIISGSTNSTISNAYASFRGENAQITIDLGEEIPINRISANITNSEATRTIRVEVADDTNTFETVFTGNILNYEYSLVRWIPRSKQNSRTVDVRILDSEEATSEFLSGEGFGSDLINFILNNHSSNFSTNFNQNQLSRYSFRPNAFGDKTLTIFGSSSDTDVTDYDGSITVNTQMDEDGYFANDISMGLGLIERPLNIDFPLKNVRKVRITVLNSGQNTIRMNGFKVYTPLIDAQGDYVTPQSEVNWNIRLSSFVV